MHVLRPIATDTSDFPQMRGNGCIYVDKTAYLHRMISSPGTRLHFISRPRRFGKSLMISTLKAIFEGRRELFDGLAISKTDWQWQKHPIIHLDMSNLASSSMEDFLSSCKVTVRTSLANAGFTYDDTMSPAENLGAALPVLSAAAGDIGVVVLIDEYDAPVAHSLDDIEKAEVIRTKLAEIYQKLKIHVAKIRFLMMTGVSKFTKMSVFSALNNIVDISMSSDYATMLGYTEEELEANFHDHMIVHAKRMGCSYEEYREKMRFWYNGFRFAKFNATTVYNPISVALTLASKEPVFGATWAETGRPSMLMNNLGRNDILAIDPERVSGVDKSEFDVADLHNLKPIGMLLQAGYLTIKSYNPQIDTYTLGVPDEEIRRDLAVLMTGVAAQKDTAWAASLGKQLLINNWPRFFDGLKSLYAAMAYGHTESRPHENSYGRCLAFLLASCGFKFRMEDVQSYGRADVIAEHPVGIYIFELKVDESTDAAFAQIESKGYAEPYKADGRPIWLIALSFDPQTHRLVDCAVRQKSA